MKRKLLTGFLAGMLAISGIVVAPTIKTVDAQTLNDIRSKKAVNDKKKKEKQSELSKVKSEKTAIQKQVDEFNRNITSTTEKIVKNQEAIMENQNEIEKLEVEIEDAEARIAERDIVLKERVRSMHVNGGAVNYLEVLLGSQSFGDFLDRVLALNVIAEQDRTIIEEQKVDKQLLEDSKAEVEKLTVKIKTEQAELEQLKKELTVQLDKKESLLSEVEEEEEHLHAEYEELENLDKLIAEEEAAFKRLQELEKKQAAKKQTAKKQTSNKRSGSSKSSGQVASSSGFIFPTSGPILSRFRPPHRPNHNGIDISLRSKPPVRAVANGVVSRVVTGCGPRSTGCGGGYGNHVIITHNVKGKKVSTLYAHLDNGTLTVSNGQSVSQGQVIGRMGNSGNVSGPTGIHLHFEVHPGGYRGSASAVNPCNWIGC